MLTDDLLDQLRFKGEGSDLDYKAERYPFVGATDEAKSELLKDILAMANAHRDGTAYILIGFKESQPHPAETVGVPAEGAIDDSRIQQFVTRSWRASWTSATKSGSLKGTTSPSFPSRSSPDRSTSRGHSRNCRRTRSTSDGEARQASPLHERWQ